MQRSKITRTLLPSVFFAWTALAGATALAGEIKIGQDNELETSDKGALTPAGKKAAVTELDNVPGEDLWVAHIWAQLDRPAPGPLYIEFWQKINGQDAIAKRHEEADFEGDKFINIAVELEGNLGFNKDREYSIRIIQASAKGSDIAAGLKKVHDSGSAFVSRGDKSGTHAAELRQWKNAGIEITGKPAWYKECGCGMGAALNIAASSNAYVLTDRGTWLSFKNRGDLGIVVEGDAKLFNQYGVMVVNPAKHPHVKADLAQQFADWVVSAAGQKAIADYKIDGEQLFFPNAK